MRFSKRKEKNKLAITVKDGYFLIEIVDVLIAIALVGLLYTLIS